MGASFAAQPDLMSHIRAIMNMEQGEMHLVSRKHKLNTRISTEAEFVAVGDT